MRKTKSAIYERIGREFKEKYLWHRMLRMARMARDDATSFR
jgi:hypothetical protein